MMDDWIKRFARETAERVFGEIQAEAARAVSGPPGTIRTIFGLTKANDLKKFCKRASIQKRELSHIIVASEMGLLPWNHRISSRDFVPKHLLPSDDERLSDKELSVGQPIPKYLQKMMRIFDERRLLVGHVFFTDDLSRWHLIYFDQRDTSERGNHWKEGAHIHVLNWLLRPGQRADAVWDEFHHGNPNMRGSLHVRATLR
jgi:hypothetical protein